MPLLCNTHKCIQMLTVGCTRVCQSQQLRYEVSSEHQTAWGWSKCRLRKSYCASYVLVLLSRFDAPSPVCITTCIPNRPQNKPFYCVQTTHAVETIATLKCRLHTPFNQLPYRCQRNHCSDYFIVNVIHSAMQVTAAAWKNGHGGKEQMPSPQLRTFPLFKVNRPTWPQRQHEYQASYHWHRETRVSNGQKIRHALTDQTFKSLIAKSGNASTIRNYHCTHGYCVLNEAVWHLQDYIK